RIVSVVFSLRFLLGRILWLRTLPLAVEQLPIDRRPFFTLAAGKIKRHRPMFKLVANGVRPNDYSRYGQLASLTL
ncbi:MAG: hypothetical protein WBQ54_01285, partial [Pseudolabrys sp.]